MIAALGGLLWELLSFLTLSRQEREEHPLPPPPDIPLSLTLQGRKRVSCDINFSFFLVGDEIEEIGPMAFSVHLCVCSYVLVTKLLR